jgi:hypothetical protein
MKNKNIPENFMISERGVRKSARHCPHSMAFPAVMSALKAFMGLPQRLRDIEAHGMIWKGVENKCPKKVIPLWIKSKRRPVLK